MSKEFSDGCLKQVEYESPSIVEHKAAVNVVFGDSPYDIVTDDVKQTFEIKIIEDPEEEDENH